MDKFQNKERKSWVIKCRCIKYINTWDITGITPDKQWHWSGLIIIEKTIRLVYLFGLSDTLSRAQDTLMNVA